MCSSLLRGKTGPGCSSQKYSTHKQAREEPMTTHVRYFIIATIVCLIGAVHSAVPAEINVPARIKEAGKIVFCTELAFPPWEMLDAQTQQPTGFDIDFATAVAKQMGVKSEHKNIA